jgi:hypothetical protein
MIAEKFMISIISIFVLSIPAIEWAAEMKVDFKGEMPGAPSSQFGPTLGNWHIDKDGSTIVYAADGREKGTAFPVSILKGFENFRRGSIEATFKPISGKEDQAAGIAFNVKSTGDYLVVRANALEDNLILFKVEKGRRSSLNEVNNVPTPSGRWHDLKVVINGKKIEGYLDGKKYFEYTYKANISAGIGLWSKSDSYVFFDKFMVEPK